MHIVFLGKHVLIHQESMTGALLELAAAPIGDRRLYRCPENGTLLAETLDDTRVLVVYFQLPIAEYE